MKRLLISTTALSIALSGINPAMLVAQTAKAPIVCPEGTGADCPPQGQKKQKNQNGEQAGQGQKNGQGQKKKQPAEEGAQQKKKQQPAEDGAQQKKKQQPAAEGNQQQKKKQQPAEDGAQQKKKQPAAEGNAQPKKQQPAAEGNQQQKKQQPAAKDGQQQNKPAPKPEAEAAPAKPGNGQGNTKAQANNGQGNNNGQGKPAVLPVMEPSEGAPPPKKEAVEALSTILNEEDAAPKARQGQKQGQKNAGDTNAKPRKPAAAAADLTAAPPKDAQVTRRKVTQEDVRRSGQEFTTRAGSEDRDARKKDRDNKEKAKKKDGGLSDLEKAGLVVLGALAVGALLNNGNKVVSNTGDRVVMDRGDGTYYLLKDDDTLLRQPGSDVQTETFSDGSTRTTVLREDGTRIVTIRDATGRTLRRALVYPDGTQTLLIDDLSDQVQPVDLTTLPRPRPGGLVVSTSDSDADLRAALYSTQSQESGRAFSLQQIRDYAEVRALAPTIDVESITFETGSAAILPSEAAKLSELGAFMQRRIDQDRSEMFLIEGHTDAVGSAVSNLALSDRRAESLALALTEYFGVPPENMVVQGYGEGELRIATDSDEPRNRRAVVRMISPLMNQIASAE
ncbi:MAG: OmpA family protein [Gemmobacter sp.]